MNTQSFFANNRILIVAGKGGVGKTTVVAGLAKTASNAGCSVLIVELEGKPGLLTAFGSTGNLGYHETGLYPLDRVNNANDETLYESSSDRRSSKFRTEKSTIADKGTASIRGRRLTPDDALVEYLEEHGLRRVSRKLVSSGVVEVVSTAIPGIRDVLVLGKIKQLEKDRAVDLIIVDAPATGHAVTFLTSPSGLLNAARGGPLRTQAREVVALLQDSTKCRVVLVTLPEDMPVSETIEAANQLKERVGVSLAPIVINGYDSCDPALKTETLHAARSAGVDIEGGQLRVLEEARKFKLHRCALQDAQVKRLERELPLDQLFIPKLSVSTIGPSELETIADALAKSIEGLNLGSSE